MPSFVSMIRRGPLSGSGAASVTGSGFGAFTVVPDLRVLFLAVVFGLGGVTGSTVSFGSLVFADVFSAVVFSATFGFTGVGVVVLLPAGLRVRGEVFVAVVFGAGSFFSPAGASVDSDGEAEGVASGGRAAVATSGDGSGSGRRAPTEETRLVFRLLLASAESVVVS